MGSAQSNISRVTQDTQNNLLQSVSAECSANGTNIIDGNTIISKCQEGIDIKQSSAVSVDCTLSTVIDQSASTIIKSTLEQSQSSNKSWLDAPISLQSNYNDLDQRIANSLSQLMSSECSANATNITRNNLIICEGTQGGISIEQDASAVAKCVINNSARQVASNDMESTIKQEQSVTSVFTAFMMGLLLFIIIPIILFFFIFKRGGGSNNGNGGSPIIINASPGGYYDDVPPYDDIIDYGEKLVR